MLWQNKKKFDFLSLIFDSRNILAASLKAFVTSFSCYYPQVPLYVRHYESRATAKQSKLPFRIETPSPVLHEE